MDNNNENVLKRTGGFSNSKKNEIYPIDYNFYSFRSFWYIR